MTKNVVIAAALLGLPLLSSCNAPATSTSTAQTPPPPVRQEAPEWFFLRPEVEKAFGYAHAVRIGDDIKISGAVSMDDKGNPTAVGDLEQQMKNAYSDLEKVLAHYGCTFDDVVVENVYTTNMAAFLKASAYRSTVYKKQFPTGTWLEVKGLALPEFLIEIDLEAHKANPWRRGRGDRAPVGRNSWGSVTPEKRSSCSGSGTARSSGTRCVVLSARSVIGSGATTQTRGEGRQCRDSVCRLGTAICGLSAGPVAWPKPRLPRMRRARKSGSGAPPSSRSS